jgi:hypothetical protein
MAEYTNKTEKRADLSDWLVENLRVTVFTFPEGFSLEESSSHWHELFGQPAEKKTISSKELLIKEEGPFENGILKFESNPMRTDWVLAFNPNIERENDLRSMIGPLEGIRNSFVKLMMQWLPNSLRSKRLAFGAVLHLPANSREHGYRTLGPYLKSVKLDPISSSDFLYQINRRRISSTIGIPDFTINRLTRWSVASATPMRIELGPEKINVFEAKQEYSSRLELDINTWAKFESELPKDKIPGLFKELVDLGMEIVREGDIP